MCKWILAVCVAAALAGCGASEEHDHNHEHEQEHAGHEDHEGRDHEGHDHEGHDHEGHDHEDHSAESAVPTGPNGGWLLAGKNFELELQLTESGAEPQLRAYLLKNGKPLPTTKARATVTLERLGNSKQTLELTPTGDYLTSPDAVAEPHSFAVTVDAEVAGAREQWQLDRFEGRTEIASERAERAGIRTEVAGEAVIAETIPLYGVLELPARAHAEVRARFPGVVRSVRVNVGDKVKRGQPLATVEANESLTTFVVNAPIAGTIAARGANVGELSADRVLFEIVDDSQLEAHLAVFPRDLSRVRVGQTVLIRVGGEGEPIVSKLSSAAPRADDRSQTINLRAALPNSPGVLRAGLSVTADVQVSTTPVPIAVRTEALQRWRDMDVVFRREGDVFEAQPVQLGRRDARFVEVLGGLPGGARYVTQQSFLVKADIEKAGAGHQH